MQAYKKERHSVSKLVRRTQLQGHVITDVARDVMRDVMHLGESVVMPWTVPRMGWTCESAADQPGSTLGACGG